MKSVSRNILLIFLIVIIFISVLLAISSLVNKDPSARLVPTFLIFTIVLIVMLLLTFIVLVVKSVLTLIYERKAKILGSKLKTRLVMVMIFLVLITVIPMYIFTNTLMRYMFQRWSSKQMEDLVSNSIKISQILLEEHKQAMMSYRNEIDAKVREICDITGQQMTYIAMCLCKLMKKQFKLFSFV